MKVHDEIKNRFNDVPWLENTGKELKSGNENGIVVIPLLKIEEMYKSSKNLNWENFNLDIRNNMTSFVRNNMPNEYKNWNKVAEEIRNLFEEFRPAIESKIISSQLSNEILMKIRSHFIAIAQNFYYFPDSKYNADKYFEALFNIYKKGHFPCGWNGKLFGDAGYTEMKFDNGAILIW
jgi:hypothetical protein